MLYDQVINSKKSCYIDYTAAFDSVSHKFMDVTLSNSGASAKSRAIFRSIYDAAAGITRVNGTDGGGKLFSGVFNVGRGVVQVDIISPVLFILALDQIIQDHDKGVKGVKCGRILKIKVLVYADDIALADNTVESMTKRLTAIADVSEDRADMKVNMQKTFSQHVHKRSKIKVTEGEVRAAEAGYKNKAV